MYISETPFQRYISRYFSQGCNLSHFIILFWFNFMQKKEEKLMKGLSAIHKNCTISEEKHALLPKSGWMSRY